MKEHRSHSLSARIALAAGLVALATGLVVAVFGYVVVRQAESDTRRAWAQEQARQSARRVEDRLAVVLDRVRSAATSPLILSALVDSAGKELYLRPFLNSLSLIAGVPVSAHFVDFEGQIVMNSAQARPAGNTLAWLQSALKSGSESITFVKSGTQADLYFAAPIKYPRTERTEGALIAHLALSDLVVDGVGTLSIAGSRPRMAGGQAQPTAVIALPSSMLAAPQSLELTLASETDGIGAAPPSRAWSVLIASTLLSLLLAYALARTASRRAVADVDRLVMNLNTLSMQPDGQRRASRLAVEGSAEIQSVARGVNELLAALQRSNEDFKRERELRMAGIIESSTDAIITINESQRIVQFNSAASQIFRVSSDQMLGGTIESFIPPAHRLGHAEMIAAFSRATLAAGRRMGRARSFVALRADGEEFMAEAMLTKAVIEGGLHMTVVIRDITDQVNAESERAARNLAEAASRAKSLFLANMSHEIRTPMNAIMGMNQLLLRDEKDELQRERLGKVQTASRHLLQVINDILDISKIESGMMTLEQHEFALDVVVQRSVELVRPKADEKKLELIIDTERMPQRLLGDPTRLTQVLVNLLGNAVKFTTTGWVRLRGEIVSEDDTSVLARFEVEDTGPGIPVELQGRLFDAFEQGDMSTTRLHGGTGLGLSLTRNFAQLMGGSSGLSSVPGTGSTFWFTAKLGKVAGASKPIHAPSLNGLRALLVDAVAESREAIADRLVALGLRVQSCASGPEALTLIERSTRNGQFFDVLLVDWLMEGMDGFETLRRAADLLGDGMPPSILVTAHDDPRLASRGREAHVDSVLLKPLTGSALHDALVGLLKRNAEPARSAPAGAAEARLRECYAGTEILLAEDNPINQEVAVELLQALGLVVDTAMDGRAAVELAGKKPYALILMDMQMPGVDGLEATRQIRGSGLSATPIIAMTANAFGEDRAACLEAGMNDHLAKPVEPENLYAMLLRWLPPASRVEHRPPTRPHTSGST